MPARARQAVAVTAPARNRVHPSELAERDVNEALTRLAARDAELARRAKDAYEALTWGEGPGVLRLAGVQEWLWYIVPTKYITDEAGYMGRLARAAAALFDELELCAYAAICRSPVTAEVHAAFDGSDTEGRRVLRRAMHKSGIVPPDLADFAWGDVMGADEAAARSAVEDALEHAIADGEIVVGSRGWHSAQAVVAATVLDGDHPELPGQSWRSAVLTERLEQWVGMAERRSRSLGAARAAVANRLLQPIDSPDGAADSVAPLVWLLNRHGDEQPLTQAGYLSPSFVRSLSDERPWDDRLPSVQHPRSEADDMVLLGLREWLQDAAALRKRKTKLLRTAAGAAMAADPGQAWDTLTRHLAPHAWGGFVAQTALLHLLGAAGDEVAAGVRYEAVLAFVASAAADMGWATSASGRRQTPSVAEVSWAFGDTRQLWEVCSIVDFHGSWNDRRLSLSEVGVSAALSYLRHVAAGPRKSLD